MRAFFQNQTTLSLVTLSFTYFIQATGALAIVGSLEPIAKEWMLSESESAYLLAVFGVTFAILAPLFQVTIGHIPRRTQVLIGTGFFTVGGLLLALSPNYASLLGARVIMGGGAALMGPVLIAIASDIVEEWQRGRAIAIVLTGLSLSSMIGIPLATWISYTWGVRSLFFVLSILGAVTAILLFFNTPGNSQGNRIDFKLIVKQVTSVHSLSAFLVVFFIAAGVFTTFAFITPIMRDVYSATPEVVSVALLVLGVSGFIGNIFVIKFSAYVSSEKMLLIGVGLLISDLVLMMSLPSVEVLLFVFLIIWAFSTDIVWPSQQRRVVEISTGVTGVSLALTSSFLFLGIGAGSTISGWIYPVAGLYGVTSASIVLMLLGLASLSVSVSTASGASIPESFAAK